MVLAEKNEGGSLGGKGKRTEREDSKLTIDGESSAESLRLSQETINRRRKKYRLFTRVIVVAGPGGQRQY